MKKKGKIEDLIFDEQLQNIASSNNIQALEEYKTKCEAKDSAEEAFWLLRYLRVESEEPSKEFIDREYREFTKRIGKRRLLRGYSLWLSGVACALVLFFAVFQRLAETESVKYDMFTMLDSLKVDEEDIQIVSGGIKAVVANNAQIEHSKEGGILVEGEEKVKATNIQTEFIQVIVPKGKRTNIKFSDGTIAWLNSGSKMVYPKIFGKERREIYIDGEIYIEVEKTVQKTPFIVHTNSFDVRVLGTKFNVAAYQNESQQSVVLVEGSVEVKIGDEVQPMRPKQGCFMQGDEYKLKYVDTEVYTSWKNGFMKVAGESVSDILKGLSRYYGVKIDCEDSLLLQERYYGKLELNDSLENVLYRLALSTPFTSKIDKESGTITIRMK